MYILISVLLLVIDYYCVTDPSAVQNELIWKQSNSAYHEGKRGGCEALLSQKLTCPYEVKYKSLPRVWCQQSSAECCTGLTFSHSTHLVDGGKLKVTQDLHSFTVEVLEPSHKQGVHWCGVLSRNGTIIKLAEGYIHSSPASYIWSFTRWILLPLLPMVTTCTHMYLRTTRKQLYKKADECYDDMGMSSTVTEQQYENAESLL